MPNRFAWELKHALKMDLFADFSKKAPYHEAFKNVFELNKSVLEAREIIANQKRLQWKKSHAIPLKKISSYDQNRVFGGQEHVLKKWTFGGSMHILKHVF